MNGPFLFHSAVTRLCTSSRRPDETEMDGGVAVATSADGEPALWRRSMSFKAEFADALQFGVCLLFLLKLRDGAEPISR
jgi:hypothetical protein